MYATIAEIQAANAAAGDTFFSPSTLRQRRRRVHQQIIAGCYVVSSEQDGDQARGYSLHYVDDDGLVWPVGRAGQYASASAASAAARRLSSPPPRRRLFGLGTTR